MMRRGRTSTSAGPKPAQARRPTPAPASGLRRWLRSDRLWWVVTLAGLGLLLVYLLRSLLALLIASAVIAYLLDPLVDRFEARGWKRESAIVTLAVSAVLVMVPLGLLFINYVAGELQVLSQNLTVYEEGLKLGFEQRMGTWEAIVADPPSTPAAIFEAARELIAGGEHQRLVEEQGAEGALDDLLDPAAYVDFAGLGDLVKQAIPNVGKWVTGLLKDTLAGGMSFVIGILNLALVPIFVFYLLRDWDRIIGAIDELVPPRHRERMRRLSTDIDGRLASFVRGQATVCAALGVLYTIGLVISGIDMAVAVGMLSGALFIIPYLGTVVGVIVATGLALLKFGLGWQLIAVWVTFGGVQLLEGSVLTPTIVGDKVGLHPLVVMIALLVGGNLLGLWGMLVAIPITAAAQVLLAEWYRGYQASHFFEGRES